MDEDDAIETKSLGRIPGDIPPAKTFIIATSVSIFAVALVAALVWPPTFQSSATILIEEPDVPATLVRPTVSADQLELLSAVQQRVMTTQNLMGVIDKFNLYRGDRNTVPASVLADRIRSHTSMKLVDPNGGGQHGSRPDSAAIAFTLSFDASNPSVAQRVNNELVTLYLSENAHLRQSQSQGTVGFFSSETQRLSEQVRTFETQLADFQTKNAGSLPEDVVMGSQLLDRAQDQLSELMREEESSRQRETFLQSQLSQIDPNLPITMPNGQQVLSGEALRLQYLALSAKLGENNPEVVKVRRQMEAMGINPATAASRPALEIQRASLERQLADSRKKLGDNNPDVQQLDRQLTSIKSQIASLPAAAASDSVTATNPAYIQLRSELTAEAANLQALSKQEGGIRTRIADLSTRLANAPQVQRAYAQLKRDHDNALSQYQALIGKQSDAELANSLETARKGEPIFR